MKFSTTKTRSFRIWTTFRIDRVVEQGNKVALLFNLAFPALL